MLKILTAAALLALASCSATSVLNVASGGGPNRQATDLAYGPLARQTYDLYTAENPNGPVIVFVHGGSWDTGSKDDYEFVGNELADQGFTTAVINYRLGPQTQFPGFVEDTALAVAKVSAEVANGRPVVVMGHSAGAQIAALVTYDARYLRKVGTSPCRVIHGFIGLAGPYDFLPLNEDRYKAIFPAASRPASQPINFASGSKPPSLLLHGLDDTTVEPKDTQVMAAALKRAGQRVRSGFFEGVNHTDIIGAYGPALSFLAPVRAPVKNFALEVSTGAGGCR